MNGKKLTENFFFVDPGLILLNLMPKILRCYNLKYSSLAREIFWMVNILLFNSIFVSLTLNQKNIYHPKILSRGNEEYLKLLHLKMLNIKLNKINPGISKIYMIQVKLF